MKIIQYTDFRKKLDQDFQNLKNENSITYQLVALSDLYQKIAAIYSFAKVHKDTSFQNPVIFQIVRSALEYGVCMQIRRLADGKQHSEISLYRLVQEIRINCSNWRRTDFLTWDGGDYDSEKARNEHRKEESRLIERAIKDGSNATYLPIGKHEEIDRRHSIFDLLSDVARDRRAESDIWKPDLASHLIKTLSKSAKDVVWFANVNLAHRIDFVADQKPTFPSLEKIEEAVTALWKCYNVLNSIFYDTQMTPEIVHALSNFNHLDLPLVGAAYEIDFHDRYEAVKKRMANEVNAYALSWEMAYSKGRASN